MCAEPRAIGNVLAVHQIRVKNLTHQQPFSPILMMAHTEVRYLLPRGRGGGAAWGSSIGFLVLGRRATIGHSLYHVWPN